MNRLHNSTSVKINGFYPELENVNGIVVGYADDNPIVKIPVELSKEYPYKTLIIPRQLVKKDEVTQEIEYAIRCSNLANDWRAKFCRKIYKKLMNAVQKTTGIKSTESITEEVIITPTADYHTGNHRYGLGYIGSHHFTLRVVWDGYPESEGKDRIKTEFNFDIMYNTPYEEDTYLDGNDKWFKDDWHGHAVVKVSWPDTITNILKSEQSIRSQYQSELRLNHPEKKRRISLQTGIDRLVTAWWEMHQKAEQIRKKS